MHIGADSEDALAAARAAVEAESGWMLREAGGCEPRPVRGRAPQSGGVGPDQGCVRPGRTSSTRVAYRSPAQVRHEPPAARRRARRRAWPAGSASRTARRTGSPGSRSRRPGAGSPRCRPCSSAGPAIDDGVHRRHGRRASSVAAARPRARRGVQFGHLMEGTRGRDPAAALRSCVGGVEWLGVPGGAPAPRRAARRAHLAAGGRRNGCAWCRAGSDCRRSRSDSLRTPLAADERPDSYLFTGCVMDAWQRDVAPVAS